MEDLVIAKYADDAFSSAGLTAEDIIVVEEGIQVTIPEEISKMEIRTENGSKVAYLTEGTSGSIDSSLHPLYVPWDLETMFLKDITNTSNLRHFLIDCSAVSYTEGANGDIIVTNVLLNMLDSEYIVPTTIEGKPVTTVMINSQDNYEMENIVVDESLNKIIYTSDLDSASDPCTITQIVQGSGQTGVEIPDVIGEKSVKAVSEEAFDQSVKSVIVPEGLEVAQPQDVCKIVYTTDSNGNVIIRDIVPGTDDSGKTIPVIVPDTIIGQIPTVSEDVQHEMENVPHDHVGSIATCTSPAQCRICGATIGDADRFNHTHLVHVAGKSPTCTEAGSAEYWHCDGCGKTFEDAEGRTEIKPDDTVVAAKGHSYENGICTVCGKKEPVIIEDAGSEQQEDSGAGGNTNHSTDSTVNAAENTDNVTETEETTVTYTIVSGDTLWKIARKFYGNGSMWRKIYADNAHVLRDPGKIYAGQVITIYLTTENAPTAAEHTTEEDIYVVQPKDSLWKIADRFYGNGRQWRVIYEANKDVLPNPDVIRVGQELTIPAE